MNIFTIEIVDFREKLHENDDFFFIFWKGENRTYK